MKYNLLGPLNIIKKTTTVIVNQEFDGDTKELIRTSFSSFESEAIDMNGYSLDPKKYPDPNCETILKGELNA